MKCPRCSRESSRDIQFYFKAEKVRLEAQVCNVCEFIFAEDEKLLKAARKHLYALTKDNEHANRKDS